MVTCLLMLLAGLMFAVQFCFNKYFQKYKPPGETSSVLFAMLGKIASAAFFFVCILFGARDFWGNNYTLLVGAVQAALNLIITVVGVKVLAEGSMALYTVAMMIGGMAVPVVFGVFYFGDAFGWLRAAAFVLIAAAVVLSASGERKRPTVKACIMYAALFLCNGFIGVFTALHTNVWGKGMPDVTFMFTTSVAAAVCYVPVLLAVGLRERRAEDGNYAVRLPDNGACRALYRFSPALAGVFNGLGNFLIVIGTAADGIGSAVTFPLVTGGTVLFTALTALLFYKERPGLRKWIGIALIPVALIIFII